MMLVCGAQIEAITRLISNKCHFVENDEGIRPLIRKINEKDVLSNFKIISIPHKLQFTPFTKDMEWWGAYNELKHDLEDKQFKITYTTVMDAFASLSALHRLADKLVSANDKQMEQILDKKSWLTDENMIKFYQSNDKTKDMEILWRSLLFEIRNFYFSDPLFPTSP